LWLPTSLFPHPFFKLTVNVNVVMVIQCKHAVLHAGLQQWLWAWQRASLVKLRFGINRS
jgi:hypothetical protein